MESWLRVTDLLQGTQCIRARLRARRVQAAVVVMTGVRPQAAALASHAAAAASTTAAITPGSAAGPRDITRSAASHRSAQSRLELHHCDVIMRSACL
jgi:hypothetical protein